MLRRVLNHPSQRGRPANPRVAHPDDDDLTIDMRDLVLTAAPIVYNHEFHVPYRAAAATTPYLDNEPCEGALTVAVTTLSEDQFVWIISRLDRWWRDQTPLRYVAADRTVLSALYPPDGDRVAFPPSDLITPPA